MNVPRKTVVIPPVRNVGVCCTKIAVHHNPQLSFSALTVTKSCVKCTYFWMRNSSIFCTYADRLELPGNVHESQRYFAKLTVKICHRCSLQFVNFIYYFIRPGNSSLD